MKISILDTKALPILARLGLPAWNKLDVNQKRQVAMEIYQTDNSLDGRRIYDLLSTGNPNANTFVYQVSIPEPKTNRLPVYLLGVGVLAYLLFKD